VSAIHQLLLAPPPPLSPPPQLPPELPEEEEDESDEVVIMGMVSSMIVFLLQYLHCFTISRMPVEEVVAATFVEELAVYNA
jgi:hypothetical protein